MKDLKRLSLVFNNETELYYFVNLIKSIFISDLNEQIEFKEAGFLKIKLREIKNGFIENNINNSKD